MERFHFWKGRKSGFWWQGLVLLDWFGRSGHVQSQSFGSISHASGPKLTFWGNFIMVLHGFVWRNSKKHWFETQKLKNNTKHLKSHQQPKKVHQQPTEYITSLKKSFFTSLETSAASLGPELLCHGARPRKRYNQAQDKYDHASEGTNAKPNPTWRRKPLE